MGRMTDGKDAHRCDPVCFVRGPSGIEFHPKVNINGNGRYVQVEFVPDLPVTEGIYEVWLSPEHIMDTEMFCSENLTATEILLRREEGIKQCADQLSPVLDSVLDCVFETYFESMWHYLHRECIEEVEEAFCAEG